MLTNAEQSVIRDISDSLEPVTLLIKSLSKDDCRYESSEKIVDFVLQRLDKNKYSQFSQDLFKCIKDRINERRNIHVATATAWLNRQMSFGDSPKYFEYADKQTTMSFLNDLWCRLFSENNESNSFESNSENSCDQNATIDELLAFHLSKKSKVVPSSSLEEEFQTFLAGGVLGKRLGLLKDALDSISPTSTIAERCFSMAGNFVRQRRNRISDELLDAIIICRNK